MTTTIVTRTYLEMRASSELNAARSDDPLIKIEQQRDCSVDLFRFLYREVGKNYFWTDRLRGAMNRSPRISNSLKFRYG
jgi:hypothetical protein